MKRRFHLHLSMPGSIRNRSTAVLTICWITCSVAGIITAIYMSDLLIPLMRGAVMQPVSISGVLIAVFLPFLFAAFAVFFSERWLLIVIGGIKAFGFGFCACGISLTFGQCDWLIRGLFLFTDHFTVPMLYLFCLRYLSGETRLRRELAVWLLIIAVVSGIDHCFVSPFLAELFS